MCHSINESVQRVDNDDNNSKKNCLKLTKVHQIHSIFVKCVNFVPHNKITVFKMHFSDQIIEIGQCCFVDEIDRMPHIRKQKKN